jgi:TPR repeat protein
LFMTLSQATPAQSLVASLFASPTNGARHDKATLAICERAAEQGLPTAQLALAQLYAARRAGPKDLVHAYTCFLIAGEQITQAKNHLNQSMTMGQLLEAEPRAAEWIRKIRKIPPRQSPILPTHRPPDSEEGSRITLG